MKLVLYAALLQLSLGIATLLLAVPVALGVAHQGGGVLLMTAVLLARHGAVAADESKRSASTGSHALRQKAPATASVA